MSLCQDICFGVTKGKWLLPKHLLLGMTVRHETGSAKLVKYLNRFGHSTSHSKLLELETAMYESILESESHLPCAAITNAKMTHLCWDNFDLCEETQSGSGTTLQHTPPMESSSRNYQMELMAYQTVKVLLKGQKDALHFTNPLF